MIRKTKRASLMKSIKPQKAAQMPTLRTRKVKNPRV
jgi:hypothetical protein